MTAPTPAVHADEDDKMVKLTVDCEIRVLEAAKAAGVKILVLTSASGAVLALL